MDELTDFPVTFDIVVRPGTHYGQGLSWEVQDDSSHDIADYDLILQAKRENEDTVYLQMGLDNGHIQIVSETDFNLYMSDGRTWDLEEMTGTFELRAVHKVQSEVTYPLAVGEFTVLPHFFEDEPGVVYA